MQSSETRKILVTGLRNAHAMENQGLSIMKPQMRRIEHYPEVAAKLDQHIAETQGQIGRLEEILSNLNEDPSTLKDVTLSVARSISAVGHTLAEDEILKNSLANFAFENFEIASYKSLITVAQAGGFDAEATGLKANLAEEMAMAEWLDASIDAITMRFVSLREAGEKANV